MTNQEEIKLELEEKRLKDVLLRTSRVMKMFFDVMGLQGIEKKYLGLFLAGMAEGMQMGGISEDFSMDLIERATEVLSELNGDNELKIK